MTKYQLINPLIWSEAVRYFDKHCLLKWVRPDEKSIRTDEIEEQNWATKIVEEKTQGTTRDSRNHYRCWSFWDFNILGLIVPEILHLGIARVQFI